MLCRCYNKNTTRYKHYGGKGVTVCAEWNTFVLFRDWALSNGYQEGLTIDRIDNNGNYEPSNCRWITNRMQQRNRGNNRVLTFKGESLCMADWADKLGLPYHVIKSRVYLKDWTIEEILTTPVGKKRSSKL